MSGKKVLLAVVLEQLLAQALDSRHQALSLLYSSARNYGRIICNLVFVVSLVAIAVV